MCPHLFAISIQLLSARIPNAIIESRGVLIIDEPPVKNVSVQWALTSTFEFFD